MFGKPQMFLSSYFKHDINSRRIIVHQLKTKQHQKSTRILLISRTSFKFHVNSNKSTQTQT
jgi:hypothetical protein